MSVDVLATRLFTSNWNVITIRTLFHVWLT